MSFLIPTASNTTKGEMTLDSFTTIKTGKEPRVAFDLKYNAESKRFTASKATIDSIVDAKGWSCAFDKETNSAYLIAVKETSALKVPMFLKKQTERVSYAFTSDALELVLKRANITEEFMTLVRIESLDTEDYYSFKITNKSEVVEVEPAVDVVVDELDAVAEATVSADVI